MERDEREAKKSLKRDRAKRRIFKEREETLRVRERRQKRSKEVVKQRQNIETREEKPRDSERETEQHHQEASGWRSKVAGDKREQDGVREERRRGV